MLIIFFNHEGIVHKKFILEGKTVNAELYKGTIDHLPRHIQQVHPAALCSWDFFLLHDNTPAHKAASVCQFLTPKNITNLCPPPVLSRFIYANFLFPKLKMKLEGKKRNFWQLFRNCTTVQKPVYMPMELILNFKKVMCLPRVLKKPVLKLLDRTVYILHFRRNGRNISLNMI
jgi:hypothetical protein